MTRPWNRDGIAAAALRCGEAHGIPAMAMALYRTDGECLQYHAGLDMSSKPVDEQSLFNIGSVGKPLLALAVLRMIERGEFALDDAVQPLLPAALGRAMPTHLQGITVAELLAHRSGLPFWGHFDSDNAYPHLLATVGEVELVNKTDYPCKYSNLGYFLLGCIVERVAKVSLASYLAEDVLVHLGMHEARFGCRSQFCQAGKSVAQGYSTPRMMDFPTPDSKLLPAPDLKLPPAISGLYVGAHEMLAWMKAFLHAPSMFPSDASMRSAIAQLLGAGHSHAGQPGLNLGMGMRLQQILGNDAATHLGYSFGYSSFLVMFPRQGLAGAVMCNRGTCQIPLAVLLYSVLSHCLSGKAITAKSRSLTIDAARYCGIYQHGSERLRVDAHGDDLALEYEGRRVALHAMSRSHFMPAGTIGCLPHFIFGGEHATKLRLGSKVYVRADAERGQQERGALERYVGNFFNAYFGEVVCYLDEGRLHLVQGVEDVILKPIGKDEFRLGEMAFFHGEKARFSFGPSDAVSACVIGGFEFVCE